MADWHPRWFFTFQEFALAVTPGTVIDSAEARLDTTAVARPRYESKPVRGVVLITEDDLVKFGDPFEAMTVESDGNLYIWTKNYLIWLERCNVERLRSALRNPPKELMPRH